MRKKSIQHQRGRRSESSALSWTTLPSVAAIVALALITTACDRQAVQTQVMPDEKTEVKPYLIGKDDVLDIIVWKEPQLSGKVRVVGDGTVTVPLIGPTPAEGLTCEQLQTNITKRLGKYTQRPNVTVRVALAASQVFYVLGEVRKPGSYPLKADEVLSQGLAQAGGLTEFADSSAIRIVRRTHEQSAQITVNYHQIAHGRDLKADIPLAAGDTITVP
jgi:polysaccharide export outer membrane protein